MQYKSVHEAGEGRRERRKDSSFLGQITAPSQKPSLSQFRQLTNTSSFAVSQLRFPRKKKKKKKNQIYRASVVSFSIDEVMRIFFPTSKTSKNQWKKRLRSSGGGGGEEMLLREATPLDPRSRVVRSRGREVCTVSSQLWAPRPPLSGRSDRRRRRRSRRGRLGACFLPS